MRWDPSAGGEENLITGVWFIPDENDEEDDDD